MLSREIRRHQRNWAELQGFDVDQNGYLGDVAGNLYAPLAAAFEQALETVGGGELKDQRDLPAKIRALHSSAALAINVFQYWADRDGEVLPEALGLEGTLVSLDIEQPYRSGLPGVPPTLDIVLSLVGGRLVAIESKFTEWMSKERPKLAEFKAKYLSGPEWWAEARLPRCQQLARDIGSGKEEFRHLDALQLLKHALGLATSAPQPFELLYLYYEDTDGSPIAELHRGELERFSARVDSSLGFRGVTYQSLFRVLRRANGLEPGYIDYLRRRYFPS
jgi:hypothetical protein